MYSNAYPELYKHGHSHECIEGVVRRYTKRLPGLKSYPYKSRLKRLNLTTLELRRLHIDLVWCYKIVFGLVDVNFDDFFALAPLSHTRGHKHKLYKRRCSTNVGTSFFLQIGLLTHGITYLITLLILTHCQPSSVLSS